MSYEPTRMATHEDRRLFSRTKSQIVKDFAKKNGLAVVEVKMPIDSTYGDYLGLPEVKGD